MLRRATDIRKLRIRAVDGDMGKVHDLYFDDRRWTVRYFMVVTGGWFRRRDVLISPASIGRIAHADTAIETVLTRDQVENAPRAEEDMPVSRQYEAAHAEYFGHRYYWTGPHLWGPDALPGAPGEQNAPDSGARLPHGVESGEWGDAHLRSMVEVTGYALAAKDGSIGHVDDFVIDDESWEIRYMLVGTRNWLPGRHVLMAPSAVESVDWAARTVHSRLDREEIRERPEYTE